MNSMGLSRTQTNELAGMIQYYLDHPVKQIQWRKIDRLFTQMLEQDLEYDDADIRYIVRRLKMPKGVNVSSFFVIAGEPLNNYKSNKSLKSHMLEFQVKNRDLVNFLTTLKFPRISSSILSSETDYYYLFAGFEELLRNRIEYNMDDIKNWLTFSKSNNMLEDNVIDEIARIAHFIQLYLHRPKKPKS